MFIKKKKNNNKVRHTFQSHTYIHNIICYLLYYIYADMLPTFTYSYVFQLSNSNRSFINNNYSIN